MACLRIYSASTVQTSGPDEQGPPKFYSVALKCGASPFRGSNGVTDAAVQAIFEAWTNNSAAYAPSLTGTFINGATETGLEPFDAKTLSSFFDTTNYVGAVRDANDKWYAGWRSEEHTSELQSLMRTSYAVFCLQKKKLTSTRDPCHTSTRSNNTNSQHTP